jgi:hypothetical protein
MPSGVGWCLSSFLPWPADPSKRRRELPEGGDHVRLCGRTGWKIAHCLRGQKCPLDIGKRADGGSWHSRHDVNRPELADYSEIKRPPTVSDCTAWVTAVLDKLEPDFNEFCGRFPNVAREHVRLCWVAHLVADFAACYYYFATNLQGKYKHLKDKQALWNFVVEVGRQVLQK